MGFGVGVLVLGVRDFGFGVWGLGFGVWGLSSGFGVWGFGFGVRAEGLGFKPRLAWELLSRGTADSTTAKSQFYAKVSLVDFVFDGDRLLWYQGCSTSLQNS